MHMRHILIFLAMSSLLPAGEPPASITMIPAVGGAETILARRGTAILRWKWLVRLYHVSLYVDPTASDAVAATPKRLRMDYLRGFSREDMVRATNETIPRNIDAPTLAAIQPSLTAWNALYPAIAEDDVIEFDHLPDGTVTMRHNGTVLGAVVDDTFARALFAIWIGPAAVDRDVRDRLTAPIPAKVGIEGQSAHGRMAP